LTLPTQKERFSSDSLGDLSENELKAILGTLTNEEALALEYDWSFWARDGQLLPLGNWVYWLIRAGRGFGKTRLGAEAVRFWAESAATNRIHLIAETAADARDTMIEGESGILAVSPPWFKPLYEPSKRRLTWPNGVIATTFSAEDPDQLRGPQCGKLWADELCAWKHEQATWDMAQFGLRLGDNPQAVITTTPRPTKLIRELQKDSGCHLTTGTTYDNRANLPPDFYERIITKYEGTRLGRQELLAEILSDTPGALWTLTQIDSSRLKNHPDLARVVVAVDPAATSNDESDETGIIVAGKDRKGGGYVLEDVTLRGTPREWAGQAVAAYERHRADCIVGEVNNGGEMVGYTIETVDESANYKAVRASRGKHTRAEPISSLYEKGRIHHVGNFPELEDQMTTWTPGQKSPDRMDALVWALTELFLEELTEPEIILL